MKIIKNTQYGRSMVEMLGVLAIIGVLSVGAVSGYSKAMFKHKMNQTMDIISHAVNRLAELSTMNFNSYIDGAADAKNYGIIPDCDLNYDTNTGLACPLPLGSAHIFYGTHTGRPPYNGSIDIIFNQEPFDSCVAFFNSGIYKNVPEEWWASPQSGYSGGIISTHNLLTEQTTYVYAKSEYWLSEGAKSELTSTDILNACETCKGRDGCVINWSFYLS